MLPEFLLEASESLVEMLPEFLLEASESSVEALPEFLLEVSESDQGVVVFAARSRPGCSTSSSIRPACSNGSWDGVEDPLRLSHLGAVVTVDVLLASRLSPRVDRCCFSDSL